MQRAKFLQLLVAAALCACSHQSSQTPATSSAINGNERPLRVGVTANYPPIIYKTAGAITGLEADFANALGQALGRPIEFTELAWRDIFTALDNQRIDLIMSGVSITAERAERYDFVGPYTTVGQMAIIDIDNAPQLGQPGAIHSGKYRVGYVSNTTGAEFVNQHLSLQARAFTDSRAGIEALLSGHIDFFVHDAPTVWQLANAHENRAYQEKLLGLYHPLTHEPLGWAIHKDNHSLKADIEPVFQSWQANGFIDALVAKWLPTKIITR